MEIWKQIDTYKRYSVSNLGRIKNNRSSKMLTLTLSDRGYYKIRLRDLEGKRHNILVHRLVAMAFIPTIKDKLLVDHIDRNKTNNSSSNLRWVTQRENMANKTVKNYKYVCACCGGEVINKIAT